MIRAVIFDLGGVVIRFTNERYYEHLSEVSGMAYGKVKEMEENELVALESGKINIDKFEKLIAKKLEIPENRVEWYEFYVKHVGLDYDMLELVRALHKEYITAFLSNVDISRYEYTRKILDFSLFDYTFASCFMKERKPALKIYKDVIKKMGIRPGEAVFIDDRIENVEGAQKVGMHAVHFRSRRLLDRELSKLGL